MLVRLTLRGIGRRRNWHRPQLPSGNTSGAAARADIPLLCDQKAPDGSYRDSGDRFGLRRRAFQAGGESYLKQRVPSREQTDSWTDIPARVMIGS